jgi:uncharacterized protein
MVTANIDLPMDKIVDFCKRWQIKELALFGSVLRDDFRPDSDIDLLVTFGAGASRSVFKHVEMQDELSSILGRKVDLVSRHGVERSENMRRRREILDTAAVIYAA